MPKIAARSKSPENRLIEEKIRAEQVQMIYQQAPPALVISVLVAGLMCLVLWDVTDRRLLLGWFSILIVLAVFRLILILGFRKRKDESDFSFWERQFVFSLLMTGLAWGFGGWLIMPGDSLAYQAIVYFFLIGMVGGAVASYSAHALSVTLTISSVILPSTFWLLLQKDVAQKSMAVGGLILIGAAHRATKILGYFLKRSFQLSHDLRIASDAAKQLARTDELTGMNNRRAFFEMGHFEIQQSKRYGRVVSIVMMDIDHFKKINDTWGHAAGDEVIKALANMIKQTIRETDIAGRIGGEEFAVLLPETSAENAAIMAERLRQKVFAASVSYQPAESEPTTILNFTLSLGVAQSDSSDASLDTLLARADRFLYEAKESGRNCVARL